MSGASGKIGRRALLETAGKAALAGVVLRPSVLQALGLEGTGSPEAPLRAIAGPDRVVVIPGRTYINSWVGYGDPPQRVRRRPGEPEPPPPPTGPTPTLSWSKESGPGDVAFADASALVTTASFSAPGAYVLRLTAANAEERVSSTFHVTVEAPPPPEPLDVVYTSPSSSSTACRSPPASWKRPSPASPPLT